MPPYCEFHEMFHNDAAECYAMRRAAAIGRKLAARREKAEKIARAVADAAWDAASHLDGPQQSHDYHTALTAARAAALQALTESENAR